MVGSPEHKVPACSVPQSTHAEDRHVAEVEPHGAGVLSEYRFKEVVFEPMVKRDMPPSPELRGRTGDVGVIKVPHQLDPKEASCSPSDIGVGGEISVYLNAKGEYPRPQQPKTWGVDRKDLIRYQSHIVGDN